MGGPALWVVSDGRAGIEAQALGLAEAIARRRPFEITVKQIRWRGLAAALPARLAHRAWLSADSGMTPPWPDLWVAAGRASLPLSVGVRRWSRGATFVVQLQDPRLPAQLFDLVIPPQHDRIRGPNVFPILGSPNRVTPERLAAAGSAFELAIGALPRPRVAVVIGGRSKAHDLGPTRAEAMALGIERAVREAGGSVLVTFSRRTPEPARRILSERLAPLPGWIWEGGGDNPYFAFLAAADYILVTEDSTNMAMEAAATGRPVLVMAMDGESRKLTAFHAALRETGAARPFRGVLESWSYAPLDETGRAADAVLAKLETRRG